MGRKLRELVINRIDVCEKGDNPKAHIVLFKSEGGQLDNININKKEGDDYIMTLEEILAKLPQEDQDFLNTDFEARKNEVSTLKADTDTKGKEVEDIQKKLTDAETEITEMKKTIDAKAPEPTKPATEDVMKKAGPEVEKVFKELQEKLDKSEKESAESIKKVDELSTSIQKEKFVEKAKVFKNLAEKPDDFGEVLRDISNKAPESYEKIEKVLEQADKAIEEGELLKVEGTSAGGVAGDVETKIDKKVEEIVKRDKVTKAQAEVTALEENPELYDEYEAEKEKAK